MTTGEGSRVPLLEELDDLVQRHCTTAYAYPTAIPRLTLHQYSAIPKPMHDLYHPLVCFLVNGRKRSVIGQLEFRYERGDHFVNARDQPALGVIDGTGYRAVTLELNPVVLADVATTVNGHRFLAAAPPSCSAPASLSALDALLRLVRLLDHPDEIPALAPHLEFELLFRVLQGTCGPTLRVATYEFALGWRARPVVTWIRQNLDRPLDVAALAQAASMSTSSLYRAFKAATGMTPLQFQKRLRLEEARRLLVTGRLSVDVAGRSTGYRSSSQFSREYRRHFGEPPSIDAGRYASSVPAAPQSPA